MSHYVFEGVSLACARARVRVRLWGRAALAPSCAPRDRMRARAPCARLRRASASPAPAHAIGRPRGATDGRSANTGALGYGHHGRAAGPLATRAERAVWGGAHRVRTWHVCSAPRYFLDTPGMRGAYRVRPGRGPKET